MKKFDELIFHVIKASIFILNFGLAAVVFTVVCARFVGSPLVWIEEMSILFALWLYFMGCIYCARNNSHIGGGFADIWFKGKKLRIIKSIALFIDLTVVSVFTILSVKYFIYLINSSKSSLYLRMNKSVWEAAMVVGFSMMVIYLIKHFYNSIKNISKEG